MKIIIDIGHPAHVHYFRNMIRNLERAGSEVLITARDKEITLKLLDSYGLRYVVLDKHRSSMMQKVYGLVKNDYELLKLAKKYRPDIFLSFGSPYAAQVSRILNKPHIAFTDTEEAKLIMWLTFPFTETICTPKCYLKDLGPKKQVRFDGFFELAYLHPNYFKPDPSVLDEAGLTEKDRFIVLRFISWAASHDVGLGGISGGSEVDFVKKLEDYGRVFITSERPLNPALEKYRITCSPEKIHSLMHYSDLYVGEGGTMAVESALLGVPAIHIEANSQGVATGNFYGNFLELRNKYDILQYYPNQREALDKAIEILENPKSKQEWQKKRDRLLSEKIDVTAWMTDFVMRFPESFHEQREYKTRHHALQ